MDRAQWTEATLLYPVDIIHHYPVVCTGLLGLMQSNCILQDKLNAPRQFQRLHMPPVYHRSPVLESFLRVLLPENDRPMFGNPDKHSDLLTLRSLAAAEIYVCLPSEHRSRCT